MKKQIRKSCFETNSSSMHSIVVTKDNNICTQEEIRNEFFIDQLNKTKLSLYSWSTDFGRSYDYLSTFEEKLRYALAEFCGDCYTLKNYLDAEDLFFEKFEPLLIELTGVEEVEPHYEYRSFHVYKDSYKEVNEMFDVNEVIEVPYEDIDYSKDREDRYKISKSGREIMNIDIKVIDCGSIDHQSLGLLKGFMKKYNISLKDFLIRKSIAVVVDGDEYCIFDNMIQDGIINMKNIKTMYPSYGDYKEDE